MKITKKIIAASLIIIAVAAVFATNSLLTGKPKQTVDGFYVGVTYGGDTVAGAKTLIDKVKDYTNLFVLQSGSIQYNGTAITEIGDYAVSSGLKFMVYFGPYTASSIQAWLDSYHGQWGSSFLGFYYCDEPGGSMLDDSCRLGNYYKYPDRSISWNIDNGTARYWQNGTIEVDDTTSTTIPNAIVETNTKTIYYSNGTIAVTTYQIIQEATIRSTLWGNSIALTGNATATSPVTTILKDNTSAKYTYQQLLQTMPLQNPDMVAKYFVDSTNQTFTELPTNTSYLTSDYGLYWYDYLAGYNTVLAQLGWNNSVTQEIGLVRGAANLQGKDWGTIITWKYTQAPYLASGDEIYQQMVTSYECGAKYVVVFNYAPDMNGTYGTLQEEHFDALKHFWNDLQSGNIKHGEVKAEATFVLPSNYGSGLRSEDDNIWGLWTANATDQQIWQNLQSTLSVYGEKLDIIYSDSTHPVTGKYSQVIYWNQTA